MLVTSPVHTQPHVLWGGRLTDEQRPLVFLVSLKTDFHTFPRHVPGIHSSLGHLGFVCCDNLFSDLLLATQFSEFVLNFSPDLMGPMSVCGVKP